MLKASRRDLFAAPNAVPIFARFDPRESGIYRRSFGQSSPGQRQRHRLYLRRIDARKAPDAFLIQRHRRPSGCGQSVLLDQGIVGRN